MYYKIIIYCIYEIVPSTDFFRLPSVCTVFNILVQTLSFRMRFDNGLVGFDGFSNFDFRDALEDLATSFKLRTVAARTDWRRLLKVSEDGEPRMDLRSCMASLFKSKRRFTASSRIPLHRSQIK